MNEIRGVKMIMGKGVTAWRGGWRMQEMIWDNWERKTDQEGIQEFVRSAILKTPSGSGTARHLVALRGIETMSKSK